MLNKTSNIKKIGLVLLITGLDMLFGPLILSIFKRAGIPVYSAANASRYPMQMLLQTLLLSSYALVLCGVMYWKLRRNFAKEMYLRVHGKLQWSCILLLTALLLTAGAIGLQKTRDPVLIFFDLFYYIFAIGFTEEFVIRGVCVYVLKGLPWQVRYLLPNFLFAILHVFAFSGFTPLTWAVVMEFSRAQLWGLMANGCCLQLVKERTGTLWIPILLHGLLDFMIIFL